MRNRPSVMISSTFYDLCQVREDLRRFIAEDLEYSCIASEHSSFPVDPSLDTIENCRTQVNNADVMVLIIGGRYGNIDDKTGKSITNLEFLAAREKGIPVYAFVEKNILAVLQSWKSNPKADFSKTVDTSLLFEFIDNVRSQERVWTFPFEVAKDIINTLRVQFAYLFRDALELRNRLGGTELPSFMTTLSPKALRIALEKPVAWEYRLLLQCLADDVVSRADIRREYNAGLTAETADFVPAGNAVEWMLTRIHELEGLVDSGNKLFKNYANEAAGEPGMSANAESQVWVAHTLGKVYENTLKWAKRIRCARIEPPFDRLAPEMALFVDNLIRQFNEYPLVSLAKIDEALETPSEDRPQQIELIFVLEIANQDRFNEAMGKIEREFRADLH